MAISFERIPSNIRVPIFYVEVSNRMAGVYQQNQVALLIGPMLPSGRATPLQPVMVSSADDAAGLFGAGSILADMVSVYRRNDGFGTLWCIPHSDAAFPQPATLTSGPFTLPQAAALLLTLQALTDGGLSITINGAAQDTGPLDFTGAATLADCAAIIQAGLTGVAVTWANTEFVIATNASGPTATITVAAAPATGTDISTDCRLTTATAAVVVPGADAPGVPAGKDIGVTGPATGPGSIFGYIGGDRIVTNISAGMSAAQIVAAIAEKVNSEPFCLMRAAPSGTDPTHIVFTAKNSGVIGDGIDISVNLRGIVGGEMLPPGVGLETSVKIPGVGQPPLADVIAAMGDDEYDFVGSPYNDVASLDAFDELMNDVSGRWAWDRQIYGGVFTAREGSASGLQAFGVTRNGPHVYVLGYPVSPSPAWRRTAALTAQASVGLRNDPGRPLQTLPLVGVLAPERGSGFSISDKNTLLYSGIGVEKVERDGQVHLQRVISTYQRNVWGQPDPSWLDVQTAYLLMYIIRYLRQRLLQKFPRHKLANDGTPFGYGQAVATPSIIRGELVAAYSELQSLGFVENMDAFKEHLIVERNMTDPNRVDILFPPDLINQLRILAMLVEFRLAYPQATLAAAA